ncbi:nicotinate-nicotinamide nucleotide adenylyltransferase [Mycoplasmatota bacterium zrk1]
MNVIFGGVFNPPTLAHFKAAEEIKKRFNVKEFIFLPVGLNYELKNVSEDVHRVNMLRIMAKLLDAKVSLIEIESDEFLGTYRTLKMMNLSDSYFLLGSDNLYSLEKWKNAELLMEEFRFIVLNRQDNILKVIEDSEFLSKYKNRFTIISDFNYNISSTEYRNNFDSEFLLDEVAKYIKDNGLYRR